MKKTIIISFACIALLVSACKNSTETKTSIDSATLTNEVTESENTLFNLLKQGKVNEAAAMHTNNASYRNIVNGNSRTFAQMDSTIKGFAARKIKGLEYTVAARDFLIVDPANVLETVEATRKVISTADSIVENKPVILSILWSKDSTKWNIAYLHSSYKIEK